MTVEKENTLNGADFSAAKERAEEDEILKATIEHLRRPGGWMKEHYGNSIESNSGPHCLVGQLAAETFEKFPSENITVSTSVYQRLMRRIASIIVRKEPSPKTPCEILIAFNDAQEDVAPVLAVLIQALLHNDKIQITEASFI